MLVKYGQHQSNADVISNTAKCVARAIGPDVRWLIHVGAVAPSSSDFRFWPKADITLCPLSGVKRT
jgi:hypothetical protein